MSRLTRTIGAVVAGGVIGTLGWHVALAADPQVDTLVVCQRPGADLRSPAANGTCPSGYTKTEITETPPSPVRGYHARGVRSGSDLAQNTEVVDLDLPNGTYSILATGSFYDPAGGTVQCVLAHGGDEPAQVHLETSSDSWSSDEGAMSAVVEVTGNGPVQVYCYPPEGPDWLWSSHDWQITATQLDQLTTQ